MRLDSFDLHWLFLFIEGGGSLSETIVEKELRVALGTIGNADFLSTKNLLESKDFKGIGDFVHAPLRVFEA